MGKCVWPLNTSPSLKVLFYSTASIDPLACSLGAACSGIRSSSFFFEERIPPPFSIRLPFDPLGG